MRSVHLEFSDDSIDEIERLIQKTRLSDARDIVNHALSLFAWAVGERERGRSIASVDDRERTFREVNMAALEQVSPLCEASRDPV